jgi:sec-independent protein translocase protein TatC
MEKIRYLHRPPEPDPKIMSFVEHLDELRSRLIKMVAAIVVASIAGWFLEPSVLRALDAPLIHALVKAGNKITTPVTDTIYGAFTIHLKLAVLEGIVMSMPILVWQIWGFVVPALPRKFYRYGPFVMLSGLVLFAAGGLTGYFVMPLAINFFISQGGGTIGFIPIISNYISFVSLIIVVFGISYEMPLVLVMLSLAGITNSGWLWRKRVVAFFIIFAVSTVITPGADWISPLILGAILFVLFLVSILVAKLLGH